METMNIENVAVITAWFSEYLYSDGAITPPPDDATIKVTTGSSQTDVMDSNECFWAVILRNASIQ